jgi:hypothetical protein
LDLITPRLTELCEMGAIRKSRDQIFSGGPGRPRVVWEVVDLACPEIPGPVAPHNMATCDAPGCADGRADDVPNWFKRYGN